MIQWMRRAMPMWAWVFVGFLYGCCLAVNVVIAIYLPDFLAALQEDEVVQPLIYGSILALAAAGYGACRVGRAHPIFHPLYFQWLFVSPRRPRQALPFAPLHLVCPDAVVLAVLCLLAVIHMPGHATVVPLVFFLGYSVVLLFACRIADLRGHVYTLALSCLALMLSALWQPLFLLTLLAVLAITQWLARDTMRRFPWGLSCAEQRRRVDTTIQEGVHVSVRDSSWKRVAALQAGLPFGVLSPQAPDTVLKPIDRVMLPLTFSLYYAAGMFLLPHLEQDSDIAGIAMGGAIAGGLAWLLCCGIGATVYFRSHAAPITLAGRVATKRLFIPGFDRVFLAPVLSGGGGLACLFALNGIGSPPLAPVVAFSVAMAALFALAPPLRGWSLTGPARIRCVSASLKQMQI